ncbi:zinc finger lsd1 subclass family protein (macronuclear) [Tetrahymena thermophila SB210]|uniref:Zinc finger lsd1 subclass family protein n=1 Tax=Tetrahymena thermophila (strain SB210) TaxID=312017 RepID=I7M944_TETTS|nr:zinc finger lsd1 subclass family protein [Tetrahymena thermophila SB210]EAS00755.2 zinc finger lsd1 subclass family protein [Tetrahymena thermophila SB210]|eukprot:XP_001021000.2 zinc finger lsd1 subclass family protein [Tetrahymena thermophila SB210]
MKLKTNQKYFLLNLIYLSYFIDLAFSDLLSSQSYLLQELDQDVLDPSLKQLWENSKIIQCEDTDFIEFDNKYILSSTSQNENSYLKRDFEIPIPHYKISLSFEILLLNSMEKNNAINIQYDGMQGGIIIFDHEQARPYCFKGQNQILEFYQMSFIHNTQNLVLNLTRLAQPGSNDIAPYDFALKNIFIEVHQCHQSCSKCSGPSHNECTACPEGASLTDNTCTCQNGKLFLNYKCVDQCSYKYIQDHSSQSCIQNNCNISQCSQCDSDKFNYCELCQSDFFNYEGQCIKRCPLWTFQQGQKCIIKIIQTSKSSSFLLQGLYNQFLSQDEANSLQLQYSGFSSTQQSQVRYCGNQFYVGGPLPSTNQIFIKKSISFIPPHYMLTLSFNYVLIDMAINEGFKILIDGRIVAFIYQSSENLSKNQNICGASQIDTIDSFSYTFKHSLQNITIEIYMQLTQPFTTQSFGIRDILMISQNCNDNCEECNQQGVCTQCQQDFMFQESDNTCRKNSQCSPGHYSDLTQKKCLKCHSQCKTCSGSQINQCMSCQNGKYLSDSNCVEQCPAGSFLNKQRECQNCNSTCQTCSDDRVYSCLTCPLQLVYQEGYCLQECSSGYYFQMSNRSCYKCSSQCKECFGPDSDQCKSCHEQKYILDSQCVNSCPQNYFVSTANICEKCDEGCSKCDKSSSNCQECKSGYLMLKNQCFSEPPAGYYLDGNQFKECFQGCAKCINSSKDSCLSCMQNYFTYQDNTCVDKCPEGFFPNQNKQCQMCSGYCKTCTSFYECTTCNYGLFELNGKCVSECPSQIQYFQDEIDLKCIKCNSECPQQGCKGPTIEDCIDEQIQIQDTMVSKIIFIQLSFWIVCCIVGYMLDKFQSKSYLNKNRINQQEYEEENKREDKKQMRLPTKENQMKEIKLNFKKNSSSLPKSYQIMQQDQNINIQKIEFPQVNKDCKEDLSFTNDNISVNSNSPTKIGSQTSFNKNSSIVGLFSSVTQFMEKVASTPEGSPKSAKLKEKENNQIQMDLSQALQIYQVNQKNNKQEILPTFSGDVECITKFENKSLQKMQDSDNSELLNEQSKFNQKLYFTLAGNEIVSFFVFYDHKQSRITKSSLFFLKNIFLISFQIFALMENSLQLSFISILLGITLKGIISKSLIYIKTYQIVKIAVSLLITIAAFFLLMTQLVYPELKEIKYSYDRKWALYYLFAQTIDIVIIQSIISFLSYYITRKNTIMIRQTKLFLAMKFVFRREQYEQKFE